MTSSGVERAESNAVSNDESLDFDAESIFAELRPWLLAIASRGVGDVVEAEDIVQEAWIRWHKCDRSVVRNPRAFLSAATARLSSNAVQSARARHESCTHTWPLEAADVSIDPAFVAERGEAIEVAMQLALEKLSPDERAAFVLRHAFDYPYGRIAEIIQQTQASVRQHVSRARKRLTGGQAAPISAIKHKQLLDAFLAGAHDGNLVALEQLLAADVIQAGHRRGFTPNGANLVRNASATSVAAVGPVTGVHEHRGRTEAKAAATRA